MLRDAGDFSDAAGEREIAPKCETPTRCGRLGRSDGGGSARSDAVSRCLVQVTELTVSKLSEK